MIKSNNQKGVSLIITFLIMTVMLGTVLGISVMLASETKITASVGNSVSSFYAAQSGAEKTLYYDRKQLPVGAERGICSICSTCSAGECTNCIASQLAVNGCSQDICNNCQVTYSSTFDNRTYNITATVAPDGIYSTFTIQSKGFYKDTSRAVEIRSSILP